MSEEATIEIYRRWNFIRTARPFILFVDDQEVDNIFTGTKESFKITAGNHSIYLRDVFWWKTNVVEVQLNSNDYRSFECGVSPQYLSLLASIFIFASISGFVRHPSNYLEIGIWVTSVLALILIFQRLRQSGMSYLKETGQNKD